MKDILWYLLAGTRGGPTRARLLWALQGHPKNAHQLAKALKVDYSTIQHHLELLQSHQVVEALAGPRYGQPYRLTPMTRELWPEFESVWARLRVDLGKPR